MMRKECPVDACTERIPWHFFVCPAHWAQVPRELRDELFRTYRFGTGVHNDDYRAAREAAIAAVEPQAVSQ